MRAIRTKLVLIPLAAALSLGFTVPPLPQGGSQLPQVGKKAADEDSLLLGIDDLASSSWPGLSHVSGLGSLGSLGTPVARSGAPGSSGAGSSVPGSSGAGNSPRLPNLPKAPGLPQAGVIPTAPVAPLSQFMP